MCIISVYPLNLFIIHPMSIFKNILYVDDDIDDHEYMHLTFKGIDPAIHIVSIYDGRQALDYLENAKF